MRPLTEKPKGNLNPSSAYITDMNLSQWIDSGMSLDGSVAQSDNLTMHLPEISRVHLIHVNPELNMARFYGIAVQPTLFGEVSVLRNWRRIGTRGRAMMVTYEDASQAAAALMKLDKQKRRRGYVAVTA